MTTNPQHAATAYRSLPGRRGSIRATCVRTTCRFNGQGHAVRRHNSMTSSIGPFGRGAFLNYDWQALPGTDAIVLITPQGVRYNLAREADGAYRARSGRAGGYGIEARLDSTLINVRRQDGATYQFPRSGAGNRRLTALIDPNGNRVTLSRDTTGRITTITDARGRFYYLAYQGNLITQVTDPLGRVFTQTVDYARNLLLAETDALGRVTRYTYDQNGNRTSLKDPEGNITLIEYDLAHNKPATITDALGNATTEHSTTYGFGWGIGFGGAATRTYTTPLLQWGDNNGRGAAGSGSSNAYSCTQ